MSRTGTRSGFTLIEALTAIAVLVIVLPVISAGFAQVTDAAGMVRDRAKATAMAQSHLEQLVAEGAAGGGWQLGMSGNDENGMHYEPSLSDWENDGYTRLLTVRVTWMHRNRQMEVSLSTIVYAQGSTTQSSTPGIGGLGFGGTP